MASEEAGPSADPQQQELSRLELILRRPDYVLERTCMGTIMEYVRAGGTPQNVVEILTDGYVGYAHMASLMCQWLGSVVDDDDTEAGASSHAQPSTSQQAERLAGMGTTLDATGRGAGTSGVAGTGNHGATGDMQQYDEASFLQEFVQQVFDPEKVADVFKVRQGRAPPWLEGLTADPRGRQLVYSLSALHRNCLLLNFAIQKILMQGHEGEVAVVGSSLASYFSVFHRLLAARLRAALTAMGGTAAAGTTMLPDGALPAATDGNAGNAVGASSAAAASLMALARELADSCAHAAHAYLHAQQLLGVLARHPHGAAFLRLSQELERATAQVHPVAWVTQAMLLPPGSLPATVEAATLVGRVLSSSSGTGGLAAQAQDVHALAHLYSGTPNAHVAPIQHPSFMQALIAGVFTPGKPPAPELVAAVINVLAYATTSPITPPHVLQHDVHRHGSDGGAASLHSSNDLTSVLRAGGADAGYHHATQALGWDISARERQESVKAALRGALSLGARTANMRLSAEDWTTAQQVVQVPTAAAALLHGIRCALTSREYWSEASTCLVAAPGCLRVLLSIIYSQPHMLQQVVDLLAAALCAMGSGRAEVAHAFSGALVVIMRDCSGGVQWGVTAVAAVMAALDKWAEEADPSLVRHALLQVLASVTPPYSTLFAQWLIKHMAAAGMRRKRESQHAQGSADLLKSFASYCLAMANASSTNGSMATAGQRGRLVLNSREYALLNELASMR